MYVEKPCSHNIHEGRIAVEMARKHKRIVQHGTQSRSSQQLGRPRGARASPASSASCSSRAGCATRTAGPAAAPAAISAPSRPRQPPSELDFNIWLGPATEQPYHENLVHYRWHWFWDFGNGDIGQPGRPRDGQGPLAHSRRGVAEVGHQLRRPLRQQRSGRDARTRRSASWITATRCSSSRRAG